MPKRNLQIVTVDWVMVGLGIVWLLSLWIFGETPWQMVLLGFGTAVWWLVGKWWVSVREGLTRQPVFSLTKLSLAWKAWWVVWIALAVLNVSMSQIMPQSLQRLLWWIMSGLWFWWWSSLIQPKIKIWLVTNILCGGVAVLAVLSWLMAWFRPQSLVSLGIDVYPSYLLPFFGHHHIAALLVLIWPLTWLVSERFANNKRGVQSATGIWLLLASVTLWFSFSRSAWLAVVLQVVTIFWLLRKRFYQNIKVWGLTVGILVLVVLSGFLIKDLLQSYEFADLPQPIRQLCYQWWAPDNLCGVAPEPRLEYWKQTLRVWQEFPWYGSGLDTFGQVAKRWQESTTYQSQYSHQVFLQIMAEQGLLGAMIWLGFFFLLAKDFIIRWRREPQAENIALLLAVIGAVIVGNLDFDWQLAGFWWPLLLVVACVGFSTETQVHKTAAPPKTSIVSTAILWAALSATLFGGGLSLLTYVALTNHKIDAWVQIWPYSVEWRSRMAQNIQQKALWHSIVTTQYRQHPEVWFSAMTDITDSQQRWLWLEQLWLIDPWRYWDANPLATARQNQDLKQINQVLERLQDWYRIHPKVKQQKYNPAFAMELFDLADVNLRNHNWHTAEQALLLAQVFDPWILHNRFPLVAAEPDPATAAQILAVFSKLNHENYGDHLPRYRLWYRSLVSTELERLMVWRRSQVGPEPISSQWLPMTLDQDLSDWANAVWLLGEQSLLLLPDPQSRGEVLSQKLSALVIEAGDATVSTQNNRVSQHYQLAQKIQPWILDGTLWWFERLRLIKPATAEFLAFAHDWSKASAAQTGYKPQAWMLFYNRVLLLSLRSGNSAAAFESLRAVQHYWQQSLDLR